MCVCIGRGLLFCIILCKNVKGEGESHGNVISHLLPGVMIIEYGVCAATFNVRRILYFQ